MKLIGAITSPYVRKVRVVMAEKKLDYQFILEDVWSADTQIMTSNPLGKVPCLVMEGGEAVFDSRVIVEYLDTLSPVGKLIPSQGRDWKPPGRAAPTSSAARPGSTASSPRSRPA
jgi:glutathione S-transferase